MTLLMFCALFIPYTEDVNSGTECFHEINDLRYDGEYDPIGKGRRNSVNQNQQVYVAREVRLLQLDGTGLENGKGRILRWVPRNMVENALGALPRVGLKSYD